jgi:hypothetical protein
MSHTSRFTIENVRYVVIHNGDWSGDAEIIRLAEPKDPLDQRDPGIVGEPIVLPGKLLQAISRQATLREITSVVETLMGKEPKPTGSFTCYECGGQVAPRPGVGRTRYMGHGVTLPIPDSFLMLTCDGCGEIYSTGEDDKRLDQVLLAQKPKFAGYSCLWCNGGHMGIDCPQRSTRTKTRPLL